MPVLPPRGFVYVAARSSDPLGSVVAFDAVTRSVVWTTGLGVFGVNQVVASANYVVVTGAAVDSGRGIYVLDRLTGTVLSHDSTFDFADGTASDVAFSPDGEVLWSLGPGANQVTPVVLPDSVGSSLSIPGPENLALSPDGKYLYVAAFDGVSEVIVPVVLPSAVGASFVVVAESGIVIAPNSRLGFFNDFLAGSVIPFTIPENAVGVPVVVGIGPYTMAITPDGKTLYVVCLTSGVVVPVSLPSMTVGSPIAVGSNPRSIAITSDGAYAYVCGEDGGVFRITVATNSVELFATVFNAFSVATYEPPPPAKAYVTNWDGVNTVTVIDLDHNLVFGSPIPVAADPDRLVYSIDGSRVYVASTFFGADPVTPHGAVSVIDVASDLEIATIPIPLIRLWGIAVAPKGGVLYVTGYGDFSAKLFVISMASNTVTGVINIPFGPPYFAEPLDMVVTPNGRYAYLADVAGGVWKVDLLLQVVEPEIDIGLGAALFVRCIAMAADGKHAYITRFVGQDVVILNLANDTVVGTISVGMDCDSIVLTSNGNFAYVVVQDSVTTQTFIRKIDLITHSVVGGAIPLPGLRGGGLALSVDDLKLYACSLGANEVLVIDTVSMTVTATIPDVASALHIALRGKPLPLPTKKPDLRLIQRDDLGGKVSTGPGQNRPTSRQLSNRVGGKNAYW